MVHARNIGNGHVLQYRLLLCYRVYMICCRVFRCKVYLRRQVAVNCMSPACIYWLPSRTLLQGRSVSFHSVNLALGGVLRGRLLRFQKKINYRLTLHPIRIVAAATFITGIIRHSRKTQVSPAIKKQVPEGTAAAHEWSQ